MTRLLAVSLLATLTACNPSSAAPQQKMAAAAKLDPARPVVVELYQSQGCSSCPPALAVLDHEADRPGVLALNFAVTYWDQLGWKDGFARPEFTARQWAYSRAQGRDSVATPTTIVGGRFAIIGSNQAKVEQAIVAAQRSHQPAIDVVDGKLSVGALAGGKGTVWIADYDPRRVPVAVRAGENGGRTLIHRNIVRSLKAVGAWQGKSLMLALAPRPAGLDRAVLIQDGAGGPIVAARRL